MTTKHTNYVIEKVTRPRRGETTKIMTTYIELNVDTEEGGLCKAFDIDDPNSPQRPTERTAILALRGYVAFLNDSGYSSSCRLADGLEIEL